MGLDAHSDVLPLYTLSDPNLIPVLYTRTLEIYT